MRANSWLYHYYTVQSKLQYSLAMESHAAARTMPTYYPAAAAAAVMPYPHAHQHIATEASLHPQLLHHPHHHHHHHHHPIPHYHPHHHHHHHHHHLQQTGSSSSSTLNGTASHCLSGGGSGSSSSSSTSSSNSQYSFSGRTPYHHQSSTSSSYPPRLTTLAAWIPSSPPSPAWYRGGSHTESTTPTNYSNGVTCGVVQLVPSISNGTLSAKYDRKVRQLSAEAATAFEGSEDEEAMTYSKDDLGSVVPSPTQSDPQTVPDLGAAVVAAYGRSYAAASTTSDASSSKTEGGAPNGNHDYYSFPLTDEQHVPELLSANSDNDTTDYFSFVQTTKILSEDSEPELKFDLEQHRRQQSASNGYHYETSSSPSTYSTGSADCSVPHTPERWSATPPLMTYDGASKDATSKNKKSGRCKRPRLCSKSNATLTAVRGNNKGPLKKCNQINRNLDYVCSCNINICTPFCMCLKHLYDSGLKYGSGDVGVDDWRFCCTSSRNGSATVGRVAHHVNSDSNGLLTLAKPLPLKHGGSAAANVAVNDEHPWRNHHHSNIPVGSETSGHEGVLVSSVTGTSTTTNGNNYSNQNVSSGDRLLLSEWTVLRGAPQQSTKSPVARLCDHNDVPNCNQ